VIAIGGNSLIKDKHRREVDDQLAAVQETAGYIADFVALDYEVVITHGNGPQVGFILRRSELAFEAGELHFVPLKNCVADTQGAIGYQIQESLCNAFRQRGLKKYPASVVTMVEVDADDPSFANPTKPVGVYYPAEKVQPLLRKHPDWHMHGQKGKGYRRLVPSPRPIRIVEMEAIRPMVDSGLVVIAAGGGGIPVIRDGNGNLSGVNAVVDKDLTSALLASELKADLMIISTLVTNVYREFDRPSRQALNRITARQARELIARGHFAPGTMLPKVEAALNFIDRGGKRVVITTPENMVRAVTENGGTHIVP
jgi:carbamate kinase